VLDLHGAAEARDVCGCVRTLDVLEAADIGLGRVVQRADAFDLGGGSAHESSNGTFAEWRVMRVFA
jgi:hypothetical protein